MTRKRAPSKSTSLVLSHLRMQPYYGYALIKITGLKSGTLYPILMRLKERGVLTSSWEATQNPGRPPRQLYKLTPKGRAHANEVLSEDDGLQVNIQSNLGGMTS